MISRRLLISGWRAAFAITLAVVTALALMPSAQNADWFPQADKLRHVVAFLSLYWLAWRGRVARAVPLVLMLLAYGICIEFAQALTATRTASAADVAADLLGLSVGFFGLRQPAT